MAVGLAVTVDVGDGVAEGVDVDDGVGVMDGVEVGEGVLLGVTEGVGVEDGEGAGPRTAVASASIAADVSAGRPPLLMQAPGVTVLGRRIARMDAAPPIRWNPSPVAQSTLNVACDGSPPTPCSGAAYPQAGNVPTCVPSP